MINSPAMILERRPTQSVYEVRHDFKHYAYTFSPDAAWIIKSTLINNGANPNKCYITRKRFYSTFISTSLATI